MSAKLSRPQAEFVQSQIVALSAIVKTGDYDAGDALQRTKSILQVIGSTLEAEVAKTDSRGFLFGSFDH